MKRSLVKSSYIKRLIVFIIVLLIVVIAPNIYLYLSTSKQISKQESIPGQDYQCALILGSGVKNGEPSPILKERLDTGIALYHAGIVPKLLLSGDGSPEGIGYDEVGVMRKYALKENVAEEDLILDFSGLSTFDSIYRAKHEYDLDKILIVTQKYHLYRAVYLANQLNVDSHGVISDQKRLPGQLLRDIREILARDKDFVKGIIKAE